MDISSIDSFYKKNIIKNLSLIKENKELLNYYNNNIYWLKNLFSEKIMENNNYYYEVIIKNNIIDANSLINFIKLQKNEKNNLELNNSSEKDFNNNNLLIKNKNYIIKYTNWKFNKNNNKKIISFKKYFNSNIKSLLDYNKNLTLINKLRIFHYNYFLKYFREDNKINFIKRKINNKNYYSNILLLIKNSIKIISKEKINKEEKEKLFNENQKILDLNNIKFRHIKNDDETNFLENYFEENNNKWDKNTIKKLSKKLNLKEYSIYKWNWSKLRKEKMNN